MKVFLYCKPGNFRCQDIFAMFAVLADREINLPAKITSFSVPKLKPESENAIMTALCLVGVVTSPKQHRRRRSAISKS